MRLRRNGIERAHPRRRANPARSSTVPPPTDEAGAAARYARPPCAQQARITEPDAKPHRMPNAAPLACACGRRNCDQHRRKDFRPSASRRGYDSTHWARFRKLRLAEEPLCRFCLEEGRYTPSEHVDHIIPLRERPDLRLSREGTRCLCAPCHNRRKDSERRE